MSDKNETENRSPMVKIDEVIWKFTCLDNSIWEIKKRLDKISEEMVKIKSALLDAMLKNMKYQMPSITFPAPPNFYPPFTITSNAEDKGK